MTLELSPGDLRAATGCSRVAAESWASPISKAIADFAICNPAQFIAQCAHESAGFARTVENLFYTTAANIRRAWPSRFRDDSEAERYARNPTALANYVYADVNGNGGQNSGDGYRYRGRGLIQLTGRANYLAYQEATEVPAIASPDLVSGKYAAHSAAWYWVANGLNGLTDVDRITGVVNGKRKLGLKERIALTDQAAAVLA